ncbi:hypothetical protein DRO33_00835 [Candidatus Bathyarchaeota archaeon]|nr:MAG: hypothetical protein DRO33_00835 [Candidatus Bathyarchaeota archaeon]
MALRAYFAPCGMGLGHVARCEVVLERLREHGPVKAYFATYNEGLSYVQASASSGLRGLRIPSLEVVMKKNGEVDVERTLLKMTPRLVKIVGGQLAHDLSYMLSIQPDVVVSDTRAVAVLAAKALGLPCACILNQVRIYIPRKRRMLRASRLAEAGIIALLGQIWLLADELFVPDFPEPFTISSMNLKVPERFKRKLRLVGPILARKPEDLPGREELKEKLGFEPDEPLIFVPISGPVRERAYFAEVIINVLSKLKDEFQALISLGEPGRERELARDYGPLKIFNWVRDFYACLKACDVAIVRGGHGTVTKCMAYGRPMLVVPPPSHTEKMMNALRAKEVGVAKVLLQKRLSAKNVRRAIKELLEGGEHERRLREAERRAAELDAAGEIARAVLRLAGGPK